MAVLRVEALAKHFGGVDVLKDVSFDVHAGEKLAIIGPNGAGKTTLFNVIGGQLSASAGRVFLSGEDITRIPPHRRLHRGLARSYQINNLFFNLTLLDNVVLALKGAKYPHFQMFRSIESDTEITTRARELLESMGLWEMRHSLVSALSYGDQRLVEVAIALASRPRMLLLDEPTAGLSTADAVAFGATISGLLGDTTLLFCAHDMDLVFNLADRVMVLCYGKIIADGTCDAIRCNVKVREVYLGSEGALDAGTG